MLYLLDANILIRAHEDYYPIDRIPAFWDWLMQMGRDGTIKMPEEIYAELTISNSELGAWVREQDAQDALMLDEEIDPELLQRVIEEGYASDLDDSEFEQIGKDPFLMGYALAAGDRVVVTKETSKPSRQRANRKVPDICRDLSLRCMNDFQLYKELSFSIL